MAPNNQHGLVPPRRDKLPFSRGGQPWLAPGGLGPAEGSMRLCVADWQPPHGQKSGQGYLHMGETSREEGSGHVQILYTQAVGGLHSDGSVSPPHRPRGMMAPGSDVGDFSRRRSPAPPTMLTTGDVVGIHSVGILFRECMCVRKLVNKHNVKQANS